MNICQEGGLIRCSCDKIIGADIHLDFPSVGATENIMLASLLAEGETTISNAAMEPEIIDLQNFLNKMGAKITGAGTNVVKIIGVKNLKDLTYEVMPDRIEAGTILCATAITSGNVELTNLNTEHIMQILDKLESCGCKYEIKKSSLILEAPKKLKSVEIKTMPYPRVSNRYAICFWSNALLS